MVDRSLDMHAAKADRLTSATGKNGVRNGYHSPASAQGSFLAELQAETFRVGLEAAACVRNLLQEIVDLLAKLSKQVGQFAWVACPFFHIDILQPLAH